MNKTTNTMIVDYLFHQSIQSRLHSKDTDKDKNVIETVIQDLLSKQKNDPRIEQRLNVCQLTNLTLSRSFKVTFSAPFQPYHAKVKRKLPDNIHFSQPFQSLLCRRHRNPNCSCTTTTTINSPGLIEAIPAFLKTSANMLRSVLEHNDDMKPLKVAGQSVMGGGMPPRWYDLFLDLLTQATLQAYMCDGQTGLETISEIFSYGYVEDEDEEDEEEDDDEEEEDEDNNTHIWTVKASDHHLLFPKTRTMYLFNLQVHQREKQFIQVKEGDTLENHFITLEKLYPLVPFEKNMCDFIQMVLDTMDIPALEKCDHSTSSPTITSPEDVPDLNLSLYKYPSDGSLLIPDLLSDDTNTIPSKKRDSSTTDLHQNIHKKPRL